MMQLVFFSFSVAGVVAGHYYFWLFLVNFFHVPAGPGRLIIGLAILILAASIILSTYLVSRRDSVFRCWYYRLSGFWMGLFINFFLGAAVISIVMLLGRALDFFLPEIAYQLFFLIAPLLLSLWGLFNALSPRVREYTVAIKNLPPAWEDKIIVMISDIHLGPVYREKSFDRLMFKVQALKPEAVFIPGDLFDGMAADFSWLDEPFCVLNFPKGIYYTFGNHDLYFGRKLVEEILHSGPIKILDGEMVNVDGLQILGVGYFMGRGFDLKSAIAKIPGYDPSQPSILMYHVPAKTKQAKAAGINLQLSGHTHNGQLWPLNIPNRIFWRGKSYGFFKDGDYNLIVSSGAGSWGPAMRTIGRAEIVKITLVRK